MKKLNRRQLLQRGAAAAAGAMVVPRQVLARDLTAPSNRITLGIIGAGTMGSGHVRRMSNDPSVQVLAVCDVDESRRQTSKERVENAYAEQRAAGSYKGCTAYNDFREVIGRDDIDAILIATPDHWHTPLSILAAQAGKDVYCEKPISMTLQEGRDLADTMRRYGRVFQTGTQYRSIPTIRRVVQFVRDGGLGKVKQVFTILDTLGKSFAEPRFAPYRDSIDPQRDPECYTAVDISFPQEPVPAGLDWDLWVGPAPYQPYNPVFHVNPTPGVVPWCFHDAFGVAASTWHLSHSTDVIQYALGAETSGPVELIHPSGGQFPTMTCRYANGTLLHFVDHWNQVKTLYKAVPEDARLVGLFGGLFIGERGWVTSMSGSGPIEGAPDGIFREMGLASREVMIGANNHHSNWLQCIRTRQLPSCHEEIGHRSAAVGHLAFVSYKLGRSLKYDAVSEEFIGDDAANRLRSRPPRQPWLS